MICQDLESTLMKRLKVRLTYAKGDVSFDRLYGEGYKQAIRDGKEIALRYDRYVSNLESLVLSIIPERELDEMKEEIVNEF